MPKKRLRCRSATPRIGYGSAFLSMKSIGRSTLYARLWCGAGRTYNTPETVSPDGFTFKLFRHLAGSYVAQDRDAPFIHLIPEPVLRRTPFNLLRESLAESRSVAVTSAYLGKTKFELSCSENGIVFDALANATYSVRVRRSMSGW